MFSEFFLVVPAHGRLVLAIILKAKLAPESGLVILLRLVLLSFLKVLPTNSRLVLSIFLNTKLASETRRII